MKPDLVSLERDKGEDIRTVLKTISFHLMN